MAEDTTKISSEKVEEAPLASAGKVIGSMQGKAVVVGGSPEQPEPKAYRAEYLGSGTFRISKPKRAPRKRRQAALKAPRRGARK